MLSTPAATRIRRVPTHVDLLTDALEGLCTSSACLHAINLRNTPRGLRPHLTVAREQTRAAILSVTAALKAEALKGQVNARHAV